MSSSCQFLLRTALLICAASLASPAASPAAEPPGALNGEALAAHPETPESARRLIEQALALSTRGLRYLYGSADPTRGGMDCSGTIHHLLVSCGWRNVPRQANTLYAWLWQHSRFHAVNSLRSDSFEFAHLRPGDLLFWSGTYDIRREPPVTHVMLYLGRRAADGRPVMFGASEGRTYEGKSRSGVGVFDFVLPRPGSTARFLGYASLPAPEAPATGPTEPGSNSSESASSPPAPGGENPPAPPGGIASPDAAP